MKSKLRRTLWMGVAAGLLCLAGCGGPSSVASLRSSSHQVYSFEVAADYQVVHERILLRARQRYTLPNQPRIQLGVSAQVSPESRSSTITLWNGGGIGIRYRLSAEIQAIAPDRTRVDLYAAGKPDRAEARLWAGWADTPLEKK